MNHRYELNLRKQETDWDIIKLGCLVVLCILVYSFC